MRYVRDDTGWIEQANEYASSRERLASWSYASVDITYYAWGGSSVLAEYSTQFSGSSLTWQKSYVYAGSRLLSTVTNTSGNEVTEYHHPDRLGTRLISNPTTATQGEQLTLPFGTLIGAETTAANDKRFTSYDRSEIAGGLDYAINRNYNSGQSRFTQVDPIAMASVSIRNPQSLNLYAYVQNKPTDFVDPTGLEPDEKWNKCLAEARKAFGPSPEVTENELKTFRDTVNRAEEDLELKLSGPDGIENKYNVRVNRAWRDSWKSAIKGAGAGIGATVVVSAATLQPEILLVADKVAIGFAISWVIYDLAVAYSDAGEDYASALQQAYQVRNTAIGRARIDNPNAYAFVSHEAKINKAARNCYAGLTLRLPSLNPGGGGGGNDNGGSSGGGRTDRDPFRSLDWLLFMSWVEQQRSQRRL